MVPERSVQGMLNRKVKRPLTYGHLDDGGASLRKAEQSLASTRSFEAAC